MTTSTPSTPTPHRRIKRKSKIPCFTLNWNAHTSFDGDSGIVHMAPDVREDFGLQPELADSLAVLARLFRGSG